VVLAGGLLWFGIFTLLAGLSRNLEMLLALRFLAGLGMGAVFPVPYVLTVELVRPANRYSLVSVQNGILAAAYLVPSLGLRRAR
jgi:MFS transporter, putative metabolite:H+ symporter